MLFSSALSLYVSIITTSALTKSWFVRVVHFFTSLASVALIVSTTIFLGHFSQSDIRGGVIFAFLASFIELAAIVAIAVLIFDKSSPSPEANAMRSRFHFQSLWDDASLSKDFPELAAPLSRPPPTLISLGANSHRLTIGQVIEPHRISYPKSDSYYSQRDSYRLSASDDSKKGGLPYIYSPLTPQWRKSWTKGASNYAHDGPGSGTYPLIYRQQISSMALSTYDEIADSRPVSQTSLNHALAVSAQIIENQSPFRTLDELEKAPPRLSPTQRPHGPSFSIAGTPGTASRPYTPLASPASSTGADVVTVAPAPQPSPIVDRPSQVGKQQHSSTCSQITD